MITRRRLAHIAPIAVVLVVIAAAIFWLHARFAIETQSVVLRVGVTFLLAFLILLVVRYVVLLWLSYLHHDWTRGPRMEEARLTRRYPFSFPRSTKGR